MLTKFFIAGLLFGLLFTNSFAQVEETDAGAAPPKDEAAVKFGEFGDIPKKEYAPILEEFSNVLRRGNRAGYVIYYPSVNESPFRQSSFYNGRKKAVYAGLINRHCGIDIPRLLFIDGPSLSSLKVELWLVPPGGAPPPVQNGPADPRSPGVMPEFITGEPIDLDEALIKKEKKTGEEEEEETDSPYEDYEFFRVRRDPADISFNFLKRIKNSSGILFFYLDDSVYDVSKARQILERKMRETDGPEIYSRVRIIFGGYRAEPEVERWEVIRGGIEPEPLPDERPAQ